MKNKQKRIEDLSCCLNIYILRFSTEDTKNNIFHNFKNNNKK